MVDVLRWIGVLPLAFLFGWIGHKLGGIFVVFRHEAYPEFLFPLLYLLPAGFLFTVAGAICAPRHRVYVALALAAVCSLQSLLIHVLTQTRTGLVNYMHVTGETAGAFLGVLVFVLFIRGTRSDSPDPPTD